jgi:hypothetical protein
MTFPEEIKEYITYDESSPSCIRCIKRTSKMSKVLEGSIIGTIDSYDGYYKCTLFGVRYKNHRLIWWLFNGDIQDDMQIDHINGNRSDNRIENLRLVPRVLNMRNKSKNKNNSTGVSNIEYVEFYSPNGTLIRKFYVRMRMLDNTSKSKSFSCEKYGDEEAFRLALEWKQKVFEERNAKGGCYTERHGT